MTQPATVEPAFLYVGGDPALDLVNTVDWTDRGLEAERLVDYGRLLQWAEGAGVIDAAGARRLRRAAIERPRAAAAALDHAHRLRQALRDLFVAGNQDKAQAAALHRFNRFLAEAMERLELAPAGDSEAAGYRRSWRGKDDDPRSVLWPVIWSASSLLQSAELSRVRACAGDDCGWMYVDRSRNGLRRWCQMRTCGTREKTRRRRTADES
jgi:predicted RNA-binding Zn ribbon-like protein